MSYEKLFTPVKMRAMTAPNRVHRTSMVSGLATEDGFVTEELIKRYQREAKGGTGTIVVEAAVVLASASPYNLRISDDRFLPGITELVSKMREANPEVKIGVQIMQHLKLSKTGWRQKVEDFKKEDLPKIVENHVEGVKRVLKAGFDFVEIHMAHAYALSSFLSTANKRTDEYGGKQLANRMRLPIEVYQAVRKEVGEDFPVGVRINGEDFCIPGSTVIHSSQIAKKFAELGADYVSVSAGSRFEDAPVPEKDHPYDPMSGYSGHRMSPEFWMPDGTHVHLSEAIKKAVNEAGYTTPVIIAGKIRDPKHAEEILASGKADMIGLCRALLADPDWTVKAKEGRDKEIVKCAACNWCLEADARYEQVKCSRYPEGYTSAPDPWLPNMARPAQFAAD